MEKLDWNSDLETYWVVHGVRDLDMVLKSEKRHS